MYPSRQTIEVVIGESVEDPSLVGLARLPVFALDDLGRDPAFRGGLQHGRLFAVGQDDRQLRITRRGVGDVSEVPSPVARESGDLHTRWVRPIAYIDCGPVRVYSRSRIYVSREPDGGRKRIHVRATLIDTLLLAPAAVADMTDDSEPAGDDDIAGLSRSDPLAAVSPLDGRYAARTAPLSPYASEAALMRARTRVEVEYLIELAALDATPIALDEEAEGGVSRGLRGVLRRGRPPDKGAGGRGAEGMPRPTTT